MNLDHATPALFAALAAAQATIENAAKSSQNPHFKSRYADLAEVLNTVRPVFAAEGLSIMQSTGLSGDYVSVTTVIGHKEGGYVSSTATCVPAKYDGQGVGSATTYLRRYSLAAMAGIAQEDDDGNAAMHNRPAPTVRATGPSKALVEILNKIDAAASREELELIKPSIRSLPDHERGQAIEAGMKRAGQVAPIASEPV
jgi:hypothetical protein